MGYVFGENETKKAIHVVGVKLSSEEVGFLDELAARSSGDTGYLMDRKRSSYGRLTRSSLLRLLVQAAMNPDGDAARALKEGCLADPERTPQGPKGTSTSPSSTERARARAKDAVTEWCRHGFDPDTCAECLHASRGGAGSTLASAKAPKAKATKKPAKGSSQRW